MFLYFSYHGIFISGHIHYSSFYRYDHILQQPVKQNDKSHIFVPASDQNLSKIYDFKMI